jgi:alpha-2-macroglobulin
VITISFDRPVVGSVERTPDPSRIVRVEPAIEARIQWRDPTTLRIIPQAPIAPGRRYQVTISNDFSAIDGGRLEAPYRFAITTAGPAQLASVPALRVLQPPTLEPSGRIRLVYSAPIDTIAFARSVRLELTPGRSCDGRVIRYQVRGQREITEDDDWSLRGAGGWDRDSVSQAFRRVVEIRPVSPLPEGCQGAVVFPSLDPSDRAEVRYPIQTSPQFALTRFRCRADDCAAGVHLSIAFSAAVYRDSLSERLHLDPAVPFTLAPNDAPQTIWSIRLSVAPRTTYRIRIDSSLTDVFGRRIAGNREASLATGDRHSALGHQLGFFSVSRTRPVLRLTHVNVDSVELVIVPIPDSLRVQVLGLSYDPDSAARMIGRLRDTVFHRVAAPAPFNVERIAEIPIPPRILTSAKGSLFAIRARSIVRPAPRPDPRRTLVLKRPGEAPAIEIVEHLYGPSRRTAIVQLTELMAFAKVSDDGGSVLVTDASSGHPVRGARVTTRDALDRIVAAGETDAAGVASLVPIGPRAPASTEPPVDDDYYRYRMSVRSARVVDVRRGGDRSLTPLGGWPWMRTDGVERLGGSLQQARLVHASVFTDRGIYRPGEPIYLTSIVRRGPLADLRVPDRGDSVRVRVMHTPPGEYEPRAVRDTVVRLNQFGTVADSFSFGRSFALGEYAVRVDAYARGWQTAGRASFQLAEYRAPEFEASLAVDSAVRFLGDTITARVGGRYYFGAPMAGAVVRWRAFTGDAEGDVQIPGLPRGFEIGESYHGGESRPGRSDSEDGVDTLDASGKLALRVPTAVGASTSPAHMEIDVVVDDLNRQSVSARTSIVMHASSFYIAARDANRNNWYWSENAARRFDLLAMRPDGRRVSGVGVAVAVAHNRMTFTSQADGSSPAVKWVTDTILRDSITLRDSVAQYAFTPRGTGWYNVLFSATDDAGRTTRTSVGGYVVGRDWSPWTDTPVRAAMRVDRDSVDSGDTLVVRFMSPFPRAEAWVTVERETVLAQRRVRVAAGEATVRIPVTDAFIPAAHVSVLLVDSGAIWTTDSTHQRFRAGYARINVSRSTKALAVDVRPAQSQYLPGDSARFTIAVRDHRSRPVAAQVTLWAVDEGVLALADYSRPDPLETIYSSYGTALHFGTTATSIASLRRFLTPPGWMTDQALYGMHALNSAVTTGIAARNGTITVNTGSLLRSDFRSTAFFVTSLVTNNAGIASTTVKLPDNVTTYRVMAVAVTAGDRFGSGESSITLTKPLLARASLPRFLRTGDAILAGAVINNTTPDSVSATIHATGAHVVHLGDTTATRVLGPGRASEVRFQWRADAQPGETAAFRFAVAGGGNRDDVEASIPMRPPYAPRYHAVGGVARGESTIRMLLPRDIDPARSRLTLRVGPLPIPMVRAAYDRVEVYPYYCSEQLTSTGQVIMAMLRLQRAGLLDSSVAPDARTLRGRMQFVVDELARRQTEAGGIGYWTAGSWTGPWLSAYAGTLLADARAAGFRVDTAVIQKITGFVEFEPDTASIVETTNFGRRKERERIVAWQLAQDLSVLHFLRRAGVADTVRENRLVNAAPRMVWEDRVWLAELLGARTDQSAARAVLSRVWRDVEIVGTRVDIPDSLLQTLGFRSHVRPVARLLRATLAAEPDHPQLAALVERVVQQGRAERDWLWNTQDYAIVSNTLADLAIAERPNRRTPSVTVRSARARTKDRVLLLGARAVQADTTISLDGLLERDGEWMALPLRIESSGGSTFYVLTVDEVPLVPPKTPDSKGMIVERWYERFDNGRPVTEVTEGDLVRGRLRITVPSDREFVAVEDLLPAGLEVVDLSLRTTSLGPFESEASRNAEQAGNHANSGKSNLPWLYGSWAGGWWSPWEHEEKRDDRVVYFARVLWKGTYTATYVARATTAGTFVRPPAHAEEMYNASVGGRSDGGTFRVAPRQ